MQLTFERIGKRLKEARESLGLSQEEVAAALGLPRPAISKIESGRRRVSSIELAKLAKLYGRPLSFFLEPEAEGPQEPSLAYLLRTSTLEITPADKQALAQAYHRYKEYARLERLVLGSVEAREPVPAYGSRPMRARGPVDEGYRLAEEERRRLGLGEDPIRDLFPLLEGQGIKVLKHRFAPGSAVAGCLFFDEPDGPCIVVNADQPLGRQRFTAAHEYCHYLRDPELRSHAVEIQEPGTGKEPHEQRADAFAAAFLMPEAGVTRYLEELGLSRGDPLHPEEVVLLCRYFGVSYEAMLWRLTNLGWCNEEQRLQLKAFQPTKVARSMGLDPDIFEQPNGEPPLPPRYVYLAIKAYEKGEISLSKLAELVERSVDETKTLLLGFGVSPPRGPREELREELEGA